MTELNLTNRELEIIISQLTFKDDNEANKVMEKLIKYYFDRNHNKNPLMSR